jgi:hypothetical protein
MEDAMNIIDFNSLISTVDITTVAFMAVLIVAILQAAKVLLGLIAEFAGLDDLSRQAGGLIPMAAITLGIFLAWITATEGLASIELIQQGVVYGVAAIGSYEAIAARTAKLLKSKKPDAQEDK